MATLTDEARREIKKIHPALVATANKKDRPNISTKGSLRVLDDEHVVFADVASPRTVANIKETPHVAIICLDVVTRSSCRNGDGDRPNSSLKVTVEDIETF